MKICVSSEGKSLESKVDPRFGRAKVFIILDTDTMEMEAIENPNAESMGGVGIQSGQLMSSKGVKAVLTGNVGPNAFQTLNKAGIEIYTGLSGKVREAVDKFKAKEIKATSSPSVESHSGMSK